MPVTDTESPGCAFESEQFFERPDSSPIRLDQDYPGLVRSVSCIPWPFSADEEADRSLYSR